MHQFLKCDETVKHESVNFKNTLVANVAQQNSKIDSYPLIRMDTSVSKGESHGKLQSTTL